MAHYISTSTRLMPTKLPQVSAIINGQMITKESFVNTIHPERMKRKTQQKQQRQWSVEKQKQMQKRTSKQMNFVAPLFWACLLSLLTRSGMSEMIKRDDKQLATSSGDGQRVAGDIRQAFQLVNYMTSSLIHCLI